MEHQELVVAPTPCELQEAARAERAQRQLDDYSKR